MELKYIPIDIYNGQGYVIGNLTKVGSSLMPVIIATPQEVSNAYANNVRMSYEGLQATLRVNLPGINIKEVVLPGYFGSQESLNGYYHYSEVAPSAALITFPVTIPSGTGIKQFITEKEILYLGCDYQPQIAGAFTQYYNTDGSTFEFGGPTSIAGNNTRGNRCSYHIVVLRKNGETFDRYGTLDVGVTDDGNTGATYTFNTDSSREKILELFNSVTMIDPPVPDTDPYAPGGNSDLAGGDGDFDGSSTPIDFPNLPNLSAVDTGLISLFNPTVAEIKALATYMWGPPFDMENWKKLFANPMDAILGLSIVPVHVPDGGQETVKVGNIDTNISMNKAGSQYTEVDCGTLNVNEYWGAYLDYEPYTHVQLYLPYIGVKEISTDDVMSKPVHIKYHVDILSGACIAYVKCGDSVLYSFTGQCAASIPITGRDYTGVVQSAINIVSSAMGMFAMGQSASALGQAADLAKSAGAQARLSAGAARSALSAGSGAANIASEAINITKPVIQKSANISSASGLLGIQVPYMILTRPRQCLPVNQNHYIGYPSMITSPLSDCSGFTVVEAIHLENIGATEEEIAEIESILHAGVIF